MFNIRAEADHKVTIGSHHEISDSRELDVRHGKFIIESLNLFFVDSKGKSMQLTEGGGQKFDKSSWQDRGHRIFGFIARKANIKKS